MAEHKHTMEELKQWQALPLSIKVSMSRERIRGWVKHYGEDGVYISFSGGKDSTVLLDIVRNVCGYKDIPAVFVNTGLEYPTLRRFALGNDNVAELRPSMSFNQVVLNYGYPVISKEVADIVDHSKKYLNKLIEVNGTDRQTEAKYPEPYGIADLLGIERRKTRDHETYQNLKKGIIPNDMLEKAPTRYKKLLGKLEHKERGELTNEYSKMFDRSQYLYLLYAPFKISARCCSVMKKKPLNKYGKKEKKVPITGQMAEESRLRTSNWIMHGCNMFDNKKPMSNPLSFWTEQDVLRYIKHNNLPIAPPYGEVIRDWDKEGQIEGQMSFVDDVESEILKTSKAQRTGCIFCMFGIRSDPERFLVLNEEEPALCDYVMRGGEFKDGLWQPTKDGMGFWFVIEWLNKFGGYDIKIPNREKYLELQTDETRMHLEENYVD